LLLTFYTHDKFPISFLDLDPVEIVSADMGDVTTPLGIAQNQL
jgi:hypothetical protein